MRYLRFITIAIAALLAPSISASAAEINGKVALSGKAAANVVISIEGFKQDAQSDGTVYAIDHRNLSFVPHVLVVRAGSSVRFENSDGMPCRIYSISSAGNFVLGRRDGNPMTITFDHTGVIEVRCAEHARIHAYVVVKENPFFALTDAKGEYEISSLPPGRYTLQAWYEGKVIESKTIEVGTAKQTINFKASRPQPDPREGKTPDLNSLVVSADILPGSLSVKSSSLWRSQE